METKKAVWAGWRWGRAACGTVPPCESRVKVLIDIVEHHVHPLFYFNYSNRLDFRPFSIIKLMLSRDGFLQFSTSVQIIHLSVVLFFVFIYSLKLITSFNL